MHRRTPIIIQALFGLALLLILPGVATAQSPTADVRVTQVDTSAYPQVTIYVTARDAAGEPRSGLTQADFFVTEDGVPVTLTGFRGSGGPISTALVIDRSGSMKHGGKLKGAQAAARAFIDQMRTEDQTTVIGFYHRIENLQPLTSNQSSLKAAINRLEADGNTLLYDSIVAGVDALHVVEGRRVLLVLTDGQDCREVNCQSGPGGNGSRASLQQAIAYANEDEQPVYIVGLGDRNNANPDITINEAVLQRIANETYGEYFYAPDASELAALYARLAGSVQNEYVLTYTSPRPFYDGTRRDIQVRADGIASTGTYIERHLINVHAHPLVGVLLLLPLLGLLLLPSLLQGHRRLRPRTGSSVHTPVVTAAQPAPALPDLSMTLASNSHGHHKRLPPLENQLTPPAPAANTGETRGQPEGQQLCAHCRKPLRPGARFCGHCGSRLVSNT